jgi:hypothetical protein
MLNFNKTCFLTNSQKIVKYQNSVNIAQWKTSCSLQTDGRTDREREREMDVEANSSLSQFCKRAKITLEDWNRISVYGLD